MFLLALYRIAWETVLWAFRFLAVLERIANTLTGRPLWPARWRLAERLCIPSSREHGALPGSGTIWLHAASLGETKGLWAFAQILRRRLDEEQGAGGAGPRFLFTTNTVAGLAFLDATARAEDGRCAARLAPPDHPRIARKFLKAHDVRALVFFEVELWPHWIEAARRADVPSLWISARLTERARRRYAGNALFAGALRRVLRDVSWIQAQTESEEHALRRLGAREVAAGGDLRGLHYLARHHARHADRGPEEARRGIAFVSLHAHELPVLLPAIRKAVADAPEQPVHVFPRRLEETPAFARALEPLGFSLHSGHPQALRMIVDAFGRVGETLARARTTVVGGSFGPSERVGGHNLWEPLLAGTFLVIGLHHGNQAYLSERLEAAGLLRVMHDAEASFDATGDDISADARAARAGFLHDESMRLTRAANAAAGVIAARLRSDEKRASTQFPSS